MRLVATADTHFKFDNSLIPDGDVFIHAGDLMYTGYVNEWYERLESLAALPHKIKLYIPGNHDYHVQNYEGVATAELRKAGVKLLGLKDIIFEHKKVKFLGLPFVTGLEGWAFNRDETWVRDYLESIPEKVDIVVSHSPPYLMRDAIYPHKAKAKEREHVGCMAYNYWYNKLIREDARPKHWISGHIHESYGSTDYGGTVMHNVAMCDRKYQQNQPAIIIDL